MKTGQWKVPLLKNICQRCRTKITKITLVSYTSIFRIETLLLNIPPVMGVMTALVLSFTLGLGLAALERQTLKDAIHDFEQVIVKTIKTAIIPLLPIYIFGIFLNMTYVGQVFSILAVFIKIIGVIFLIHIFILLLQFIIAGGFVRKNPLKLLLTMLPA